MLRFKSINFYENRPKIKLILQKNYSNFEHRTGVVRIFDWGGKPEITCNVSLEIYERETFCGTKIS